MGLTSKTSLIGLSGRPCPPFYHLSTPDKPSTDGEWTRVGDKFISTAESAHVFRRYDLLEQASESLITSPLPQTYKTAGLYYKQLCVQELGRGDLDEAESLINSVVESGAPKQRLRAIMSLAAVYSYRRNPDAELELYLEALRAAKSHSGFDPTTVVTASRMIAVWKARDGSHKRALDDLECMLPLARMVGRGNPFVYHNYLNSLAVELVNSSRWDDARRASSLVITSPYATAYPEWYDTYTDIMLRAKRRSFLTSTSGLQAPACGPSARKYCQCPALGSRCLWWRPHQAKSQGGS